MWNPKLKLVKNHTRLYIISSFTLRAELLTKSLMCSNTRKHYTLSADEWVGGTEQQREGGGCGQAESSGECLQTQRWGWVQPKRPRQLTSGTVLSAAVHTMTWLCKHRTLPPLYCHTLSNLLNNCRVIHDDTHPSVLQTRRQIQICDL